MFKRGKKKTEEEEELELEDEDLSEDPVEEEADEDLEEEPEEEAKPSKKKTKEVESDEQKYMSTEQYEEYLLAEQSRINSEIEKIQEKKVLEQDLTMLPKKTNFLGTKIKEHEVKLDKIEGILKELDGVLETHQKYITELWNLRKK